eukprot:superscaffoldBa00004466_g18925
MNQCQEPVHGEELEEVTGLVCQEADLKDGQMKEVSVENQKVLLVRTQGQYSAVGSQCSHYNAPLVKGALIGDKVRCPFHGACFNVRTGDIEEYPGLDCLPNYKVKVQDGNVYVSINKKTLKMTRRVKEMCSVEPDIKHTVLLIGGGKDWIKNRLTVIFVSSGPASLVCAETLRQNCYQGRIIIVTKETLPPFDKPKLSKAMNVDRSSILLRTSDFLQQYGIEVWTQKEVVSVNPPEKTVKMSDGTLQHYDQLLISTGCRARQLDCPGKDLMGVKLLQSYEDSQEIHSSCLGRKAVIIGASFIGRIAALNMLKKPTKIDSAPFFWTVLLGKSIRYTGYGEGYTEIIFKGKVEERKFLAFYIKDEVVVAAASLMFDPAVTHLAELMATGQRITKAQAQ